MDHDRPTNVSLAQFTLAFTLFTAVIVWALVAPELTSNLVLGRTRLTIWATTLLLIPALAAFLLRGRSRRIANIGHLLWTFAAIVFLVHAYWAIFVWFDGVPDTVRRMGVAISAANFAILVVWTLDVVALWFLPRSVRIPRWALWASRAFVFLTFAITLVVLRGGGVRLLGIALIVVVAGAWILSRWPAASAGSGRDPKTDSAGAPA